MNRAIYFVAAAALAGVNPAFAVPSDIDNFVTIVAKAKALPTGTMGAFTYDPIGDVVYVAGYGSGADLRKIVNVAGGDAAQVATTLVTQGQWTLYERDGDSSTYSGGQPTPSGMLMNPKQLGSLAPYSAAFITEVAHDVYTGVTPNRVYQHHITKLLYSFNLQAVPSAGSPPPPYGDGRDVFTTKLTKSQLLAAAGTLGVTTSSNSYTDNMGRQFAWSSDGQAIYYTDSQASFGGVWRVDAQSGAATRLVTETNTTNLNAINCEPSVLPISSTVDRIFFRGSNTLGNIGGVNYADYDTSTGVTSSVSVLVTPAALRDFLEADSSVEMNVPATATDSDGNVYLSLTGGTNATRVLVKLDPQGRLSKVASYTERSAALSQSPGSSTYSHPMRLQPRTTNYTNANSQTFSLTQVMYADLSSKNQISGLWVFKPGDFDRDNDVDQSDIGLFKTALAASNGVTPTDPNLKFDMNGNGLVSWKDVKVLQNFYGFRDGDANIDTVVDSLDYNAFLGGYGKLAAAIWTEGDFNGDLKVNTLDFNILAGNFGLSAPVVPGPTLGAVVPEPAGISLLVLAGVVARRRCR
jgi:hypothetical protein